MKDILLADLKNPVHAEAIIFLLNEYAKDEMGGGSGLSEFVRNNLISELQQRPQMLAIIAFVLNKPAGLAICIEGFSSFACMPYSIFMTWLLLRITEAGEYQKKSSRKLKK